MARMAPSGLQSLGLHMRTRLYCLVSELRVRMRSVPALYRLGARVAGAQFAFADRQCDICIEAAPRSANSFAVSLVNRVFPSLRIAHHTHAVANVATALKYGIATIVIVREPVAFLVSYILRRSAIRGANMHANALFGLKEYESFYNYAVEQKAHLQILDFDRLVTNPSVLIHAIHSTCADLVTDFDSSRIDGYVASAWESIRAHEKRLGQGIMASAEPSKTRERKGEEVRQFILSEYGQNLAALSELYEGLTAP